QRDEAHELLVAAAIAQPGDADVQSNLGWGAARLGRDDEASRALEAALRLDDQRALERFRLAVVLRRTRDPARPAGLARAAPAPQRNAGGSPGARALLQEIEAQEASR